MPGEAKRGQRGGNRHPLSSRGFILEHLAAVGPDYITSMHRAYRAELDRLARENGRRRPYHKPRYQSFLVIVHTLVKDGLIEFSGREEEADSPQFVGWHTKPRRRYYRLKLGGGR